LKVNNNEVVQGVTHGHRLVIRHHIQKHVIHISKYDEKRHLCQAARIGNNPAVSLDACNHSGIVVKVKQMSVKDRLKRKKYMDDWRWESQLIIRMMSRFPSTGTRYMDRNRPKSMG
jgi:hypothetical protein